ncbi:hypothetical protein [Streptomyces sp. KR55]|uniref:hypothetical protein n=1 Tax=Streptomyces sp. KR55 TaxID=3457425 RepID=UPI003FD00BE1
MSPEMQAAFRAWLDHVHPAADTECAESDRPGRGCREERELWAAYRAASDESRRRIAAGAQG